MNPRKTPFVEYHVAELRGPDAAPAAEARFAVHVMQGETIGPAIAWTVRRHDADVLAGALRADDLRRAEQIREVGRLVAAELGDARHDGHEPTDDV
jgi:hypothetical protein